MTLSENSAVRSESVSAQAVAAGSNWEPKFPFDAEDASVKRFEALAEQYAEWHEKEPASGSLPWKDGWLIVTPQIAQEMLRHNPAGANRKVSYATVDYYAGQMKDGAWPKTGQPLIFDENGTLVDGQHRLWACLLSGASFPTFVVTGVPAIPQLFAYIDNSRPRNPAAALQTAGFNGVSPTIAAVLKIATEIAGYTPSSKTKMRRLTPIEIVRLAEQHPNAQTAARLAASDWAEAVSIVGHKDVCAYLGMCILDAYDQITADNFFDELGADSSETDLSEPIIKLRKLIATDKAKEKPMKRHVVLGNMIKVFNAWVAHAELPKRWTLAVDEDFPIFAVHGSDDSVEVA